MPKKKEKDFKEMFEELREINSWFEEEDIDLDKGLEKLKEGKKLIDECKKKLEEVENEFETLTNEIVDESEVDEDVESSEEEETPTEPIPKHPQKELPF